MAIAFTLGLVLQALPAAEPTAVTEAAEVELAQLPRPEPIQGLLGIQLQFRGGQPADRDPQQTPTDLEIDPLLGVRFPWLGRGVTLAYDPRIFIAPGPVQQHVAYLHRAYLNLDVDASGRLRVFANIRGAYGQYDFSPLSTIVPNNGSTGQPANPSGTGLGTVPNTIGVPNQRYVTVLDAQGSVGFVYSVSQRFRWLLSGGYAVSGGDTRESQAVLPQSEGPIATTGLQLDVSPNDAVGPVLRGSYSEFTNGSRTAVGNLVGVWTRTWSPMVSTDLFGGVGFDWTQPPVNGAAQQPVARNVVPSAGIGIRRSTLRPSGGTLLSLAVLYSPQADPFGGGVYQQVNGLARGILSPSERVSFDLTATGSDQVNGPQRDVRLEVKVSYAPVRDLLLSTGVRAAWIEGSSLLGANGFGWQAFLSLSAAIGTQPSQTR